MAVAGQFQGSWRDVDCEWDKRDAASDADAVLRLVAPLLAMVGFDLLRVEDDAATTAAWWGGLAARNRPVSTRDGRRFRNLYTCSRQASDAAGLDESVAVIDWMGYDTPNTGFGEGATMTATAIRRSRGHTGLGRGLDSAVDTVIQMVDGAGVFDQGQRRLVPAPDQRGPHGGSRVVQLSESPRRCERLGVRINDELGPDLMVYESRELDVGATTTTAPPSRHRRPSHDR